MDTTHKEKVLKEVSEHFINERKKANRKRLMMTVYSLPLLLLFFSFCIFIAFTWSGLKIRNGHLVQEEKDELTGMSTYIQPTTVSICGFIFFCLVSILLTLYANHKLVEKGWKDYVTLLKAQGIVLGGVLLLAFLFGLYCYIFKHEDYGVSDILVGAMAGYVFWADYFSLFGVRMTDNN